MEKTGKIIITAVILLPLLFAAHIGLRKQEKRECAKWEGGNRHLNKWQKAQCERVR